MRAPGTSWLTPPLCLQGPAGPPGAKVSEGCVVPPDPWAPRSPGDELRVGDC